MLGRFLELGDVTQTYQKSPLTLRNLINPSDFRWSAFFAAIWGAMAWDSDKPTEVFDQLRLMLLVKSHHGVTLQHTYCPFRHRKSLAQPHKVIRDQVD